MSEWEVDGQVIEDWGRIQVVIGDRDLTFYRGIPTEVEGWSYAEPFSDMTCSMSFPGVTSFESFEDLPFDEFDSVEINLIHPTTNLFVKNLFEGLVVTSDDTLDSSANFLTIECMGSLFQADLFIKPTIFNDYKFDIATAVKLEFDLRINHYGLRLKPMPENTYANIASRNRGSFNPLLTGWIQELLAKAQTQPFMIEGEEAVSINYGASPEGYMVTGNLGTFLSFGDDFPNWGSWSYLLAFLIAFENKPRLAISDTAMLPDGSGIYSVSLEGQVGFFSDDTFGDPLRTLGDIRGHADDVVAIQVTPSGDGYYLLDNAGVVHVFGDAVHQGDGPALANWFYATDEYVDMALTPTGDGYYLISKYGKVHDFGDAIDYGILGDAWIFEFGVTAVSILAYGAGYYVLMNDGEVINFGGLTHYGEDDGYEDRTYVDMAINGDATGYALMRSDGYIEFYGDFIQDGHARWSHEPDSGGRIYQWTLLKKAGLQPEMRIKNFWTSHWSTHVGTPGITHNLTRDWTQIPNAYFGEGMGQDNCRWRNTKYPNIHPDDAPVWPGYYISTTQNSTAPAVAVWQQAMVDKGWGGWITVDGEYTIQDKVACMAFESKAGIVANGIIGPQTWAATFEPGANAGDASNAFYAPIAQDPRVEPFLFDPTGGITGPNPEWDKNKVRVEVFENYGEGISQPDATTSARARLKRSVDPGYYGTITLTTDPEEGSRFDIREGQNILYKGYRGEDVRFHISAVDVNLSSMTVTLTVDTQGRDAMTVANIMQRDKESNDPGAIRTRRESMAKSTEDRIVAWDCQNGAGVIPRHAIQGGLWNVVKIPVGEFGEVVQTDLRLDHAYAFSAAIFDRPITSVGLSYLGDPNGTDYWKNFPENVGLIISWGGENQMAGYYPGRQSDADNPTGVLVDRASWVYWTTQAPWIWVAVWCAETTYLQGRLYPGTEGVGRVPDITALPGD